MSIGLKCTEHIIIGTMFKRRSRKIQRWVCCVWVSQNCEASNDKAKITYSGTGNCLKGQRHPSRYRMSHFFHVYQKIVAYFSPFPACTRGTLWHRGHSPTGSADGRSSACEARRGEARRGELSGLHANTLHK